MLSTHLYMTYTNVSVCVCVFNWNASCNTHKHDTCKYTHLRMKFHEKCLIRTVPGSITFDFCVTCMLAWNHWWWRMSHFPQAHFCVCYHHKPKLERQWVDRGLRPPYHRSVITLNVTSDPHNVLIMSVYLSIVQTCRVGLVFSVRMGEQSSRNTVV